MDLWRDFCDLWSDDGRAERRCHVSGQFWMACGMDKGIICPFRRSIANRYTPIYDFFTFPPQHGEMSNDLHHGLGSSS